VRCLTRRCSFQTSASPVGIGDSQNACVSDANAAQELRIGARNPLSAHLISRRLEYLHRSGSCHARQTAGCPRHRHRARLPKWRRRPGCFKLRSGYVDVPGDKAVEEAQRMKTFELLGPTSHQNYYLSEKRQYDTV